MDAYVIEATWDAEAKVWVAESEDVPGLVTEAATLDELITKLMVMIPELLELNRPSARPPVPEFEVRLTKDHEPLPGFTPPQPEPLSSYGFTPELKRKLKEAGCYYPQAGQGRPRNLVQPAHQQALPCRLSHQIAPYGQRRAQASGFA